MFADTCGFGTVKVCGLLLVCSASSGSALRPASVTDSRETRGLIGETEIAADQAHQSGETDWNGAST